MFLLLKEEQKLTLIEKMERKSKSATQKLIETQNRLSKLRDDLEIILKKVPEWQVTFPNKIAKF